MITRLLCASVLVASAGLCACDSGPPRAASDPLTTAQNPKENREERLEAVDEIWAKAATNRDMAREELKRLAWQPGGLPAVRIAAINKLIADPGDTDHADTRSMLRLLLPVEPNTAVRELICRAAADNQWTDLTPAIVRSWSKTDTREPDAVRPERAALVSLYPGQPVEAVVWGVFTTPVDKTATGADADRAARARTAAWEVLGRIDPDGSARAAQLANATPGSVGNDPLLQAAQACATDLRCVPITAEQLEWASALRDFSDPQDGARRRAWWDAASATVRSLDTSRTGQLQLRHIESIRWAGKYRADWLSMDRAALYDLLRSRLSGRKMVPRTAQGTSNSPKDSESLADNRDRLGWGDLITVLVIDEAVQSGSLTGAWWEQIERDHKDTSTEYGGVLESDDVGMDIQGTGRPTPRFTAVMYTPRPTQRFGDDRFVSSDDMLHHGGWAVAHYHFHATNLMNSEYAGPGGGDMEYAGKLGRACVVVTPIGGGRMDVDYYQTTGGVEARVDLGVIGGQ